MKLRLQVESVKLCGLKWLGIVDQISQSEALTDTLHDEDSVEADYSSLMHTNEAGATKDLISALLKLVVTHRSK